MKDKTCENSVIGNPYNLFIMRYKIGYGYKRGKQICDYGYIK